MATPKYKVEKALRFISQRVASSISTSRNEVSCESPHSYFEKTAPIMNPIPEVATFDKNNSGTMSINQQPPTGKLKFVDLGSGDGSAVLTAASLGWKATGMELNPTLWLISKMRRLWLPKSIRKNCDFILVDMFAVEDEKSISGSGKYLVSQKLQEANCIMIFGVNSLMPRIAGLLKKECHRGSFVMSYRFRLPLVVDRVPCSTNACINGGGGSVNNYRKNVFDDSEKLVRICALLIYDEEEMRIYELCNEAKK